MSAAGGAMVFMASVPTIAPPATAGAVWVWQPVASSTSMREESVWGWKPRARSYPKQVVESVRDTAGMHQGERIRGWNAQHGGSGAGTESGGDNEKRLHGVAALVLLGLDHGCLAR